MIQVRVKSKPLISPAGHVVQVSSQLLADVIELEWENGPDQSMKNLKGKIYTSLAVTALDRISCVKDEVINQIIRIFENDQLFCWSDQSSELIERQEEEWRPLIDFVNKMFHMEHVPRLELSIPSLDGEDAQSIRQWCQSLNIFQLAAFSYLVELSHSFIVPLSLVEGAIAEETVAWDIAELHERFQREQWGTDPEALKRSLSLRQEFIQAFNFYRLA